MSHVKHCKIVVHPAAQRQFFSQSYPQAAKPLLASKSAIALMNSRPLAG
jgi:hypothetical protein